MHSLIRHAARKTKPLLHGAVNLLFPPRCLACDEFVDTVGTLCAACWGQMDFIASPFCECCGHPFESAEMAGTLCGHCLQETPAFTTARSVLRYDELSKKLVLGLKYADRTHAVPTYAAWLERSGGEMLSQSDYIVPVPLHSLRLLARRYNQSGLLAHAVAKRVGIPYTPGFLVRSRRTPPQAGLTRRQRLENVMKAFAVPKRFHSIVNGKTITLIDDVMTTQATVNQCALALIGAGARKIHVLSLAKAVVAD